MRASAVAFALSVALIGSGCSGFGGGDDQPTTRVVFEAVPATGREVSEETLEEAAEIMRERADKLGLDAAIDSNEMQVAIEVPQDVADRLGDRLVDVMGRTARLEFFDLQGDLVPGVSVDAQGFPIARSKPPERRPNTVVVICRPPTEYCPGVDEEPKQVSYYLFRDDPDLTGADLELKGTRQDFDQNGPVVVITFTEEGAQKFEEITRTLVERGRLVANRNGWAGVENDRANQQFALVLDGELKSAPSVDFDDNPAGIPGNNGAIITGLGSVQSTKDLALVLQAGSLPFDFRLVSKEETEK